jgi:hypothetical protein
MILNCKLNPRGERLSLQMCDVRDELSAAYSGGCDPTCEAPLMSVMEELMQEHASRAGAQCIVASDAGLDFLSDPEGLQRYLCRQTITDGLDYSLVTNLLLVCGELDMLDVILEAQMQQNVEPGESVDELEDVDVFAFKWGLLFETVRDVRIMVHAISKEEEHYELGYWLVRDYNKYVMPKMLAFAKAAGFDVEMMGEIGKCRVSLESAILHFDIPYYEAEGAWTVFRDWLERELLPKELAQMVQRVLNRNPRDSRR